MRCGGVSGGDGAGGVAADHDAAFADMDIGGGGVAGAEDGDLALPVGDGVEEVLLALW